MDKPYVQFGCGLDAPAEWRNFDSSPTLRLQRLPIVGRLVPSGRFGRFPPNVEYGDIVRGLPIPDGSVKALYSSHVLEHLALDDLRKALANCYRVLTPGGIFRMVLPDLETHISDYKNDPTPAASHDFMNATMLGRETRPRGLRAFVREWFGNSHHLWMWDYKALRAELGKAGFQGIRRAAFGDSPDPMFKSVESSDRWNRTLGIECTK
jgi:SAM-dependent methyltransferase